MKTIALVATLTVILVVPNAASAALISATAMLDYLQEVTPSNPVPSSATGMATLVFDTTAGTVDVTATIDGISLADITFPSGGLAFGALGPMHIHQAPAGANGSIVVPFPSASFYTDATPGPGLSISATGVPFDAALVPDLLSQGLYLNVHTLDYGSGEIRGQIIAPEPAFGVLLGVSLAVVAYQRRRR